MDVCRGEKGGQRQNGNNKHACRGEDCIRGGLKMHFYEDTCPQAEDIVRHITWAHTAINPILNAKLLRVHYHDCFVRGCDASLLLDPAGDQLVEKEARPNLSISGYDIIDEIKAKLEEECPGVVSCADIAALAARDAVSYVFRNSMWRLFTGRRDGLISLASEVSPNLPSPFANFSQLQEIFENKGLDITDLVALSGAHTIGVSHCFAVVKRLYNFTGKGDADPSLEPNYAETLRGICPNPSNPNTTVEMDPQNSLVFNAHYYVNLNEDKGLFQSDAALLTDPDSAKRAKLLENPKHFFAQFARSMENMGAIEVLTGEEGEIRRHCGAVN